MNTLAPASLLAIALLATSISAQNKRTPLDDYIDNAQTIIVAKCVSAGGIDILMRSNVELEVLYVVKGDSEMTKLSTKLRGGLEPGETYLIRLADPKKAKEDEFFGHEGANVIPVSKHEKIEELKALSPRIVVLRTINIQMDRLESSIRRDTFELERLKAVKKGN